MEEIILQKIAHIKYGSGIIKECDGKHIVVDFSQGRKTFLYPEAFEKFLRFESIELNEKVKAELDSKKEQKEKEPVSITPAPGLYTEAKKYAVKSEKAVMNDSFIYEDGLTRSRNNGMLLLDPDYCFSNDRKDFDPENIVVYPRPESGWDPDTKSPTMRKYQALLWNKKTPSGVKLDLKLAPKMSDYITYGPHKMGSDAIFITMRYKKLDNFFRRRILPESPFFAERMKKYLFDAGTIAGEMLWPKHQNSMNQARGVNPYIWDRFDLTLKCIKLFYEDPNAFNPLAQCMEADRWFYELFVNFEGFTEFFFLQDFIDEKGNVKYYFDDGSFRKEPRPKNTEEYWRFIGAQEEICLKRKERIRGYLNQM